MFFYFFIPKVTCEIVFLHFHIWYLVLRKWRMPEKQESCCTATKKCKFPTNGRWLHFMKLNKIVIPCGSLSKPWLCCDTLRCYYILLAGKEDKSGLGMGTFSNARTEAMVTAGARPIHVWEAHSCSTLVPIFLIIVAYLLTIPWSFFFFFFLQPKYTD